MYCHVIILREAYFVTTKYAKITKIYSQNSGYFLTMHLYAIFRSNSLVSPQIAADLKSKQELINSLSITTIRSRKALA